MLSKIDRNILNELQVNARISYSDLAKKIGLTTSPCIERVKRLEREGYIEGYTAKLNAEKLERSLTVFVQIKLDRSSTNSFDEFREAVMRLPYIQDCYLVTGSVDFIIKTKLKDMADYRHLLERQILGIPSVKESTSIVVMDVVKENGHLVFD